MFIFALNFVKNLTVNPMSLPNPWGNKNARLVVHLYFTALVTAAYAVLGGMLIGYRKIFAADFPPTLTVVFGIACILYGAYRFYRSYQNYKEAIELEEEG
jgi:uncharacterized membrane protein